tara:strand:+ start:4658 stop:5455 length:798 start_codon:yes stop_codon:yes gene_type:complete
MAGAYLSESLRKQRMQEEYGAMLQTQLARQAASQIMGQVAQQEVGIGVQQDQALGNTLQKAAGRQVNREIGRTQDEMADGINSKKKLYGLIGATANAAGILGSYLALNKSGGEGQDFATPTGELTTSDFASRFTEGAQNDLVPGVSDQLDTSVPQHFEEPPSLPQGDLELSGDSPLTPGKFNSLHDSGPINSEDVGLESLMGLGSTGDGYMDEMPLESLGPAPTGSATRGELKGGPYRGPSGTATTADTAMMERLRLLELLKGRM